MAYIFKFANNDVFVNSVKSYPNTSFDIYQGIAYYNNILSPSGAFTASIYTGPKGYLSLFEQNIDRSGSSGLTALPGGPPAFENAVIQGYAPESKYTDGADGANPIIQPFIVKDGSRVAFKTVSTRDFNGANNFGDVMTNKYPLTASISKEYYAATYAKAPVPVITPSGSGGPTTVESSGSVSHLGALKNVMNSYKILSPQYAFSSSARDLGSDDTGTGAVPVGLISIPSIFYGSTIKKGTVNLKTYVSGTLIAELRDINRNGELIQVGPTGSISSASVAGVVLYDQGFVILTGSQALDETHQEDYTGAGNDYPRWVYFAQTLSGAYGGSPSEIPISTPSSSYYLGFDGTTYTPTLTLLAHARKNELNHSNNPTYISSSQDIQLSTGSQGYGENTELTIKNTVSASYNTPTASFEKTTYISQIGIFDDNQNLLGVAQLATPVKKTENREFTFKLKIDF